MTRSSGKNSFKKIITLVVWISCGGILIITALSSPRGANAEKEDLSIKDLIEELYTNYEAIDTKLREIKEGVEASPTAKALTPVIITVKKKTGFNIVAIEVKDNSKPLWANIYTGPENSAMDAGGRHQFYKGKLEKGAHTLSISFRYTIDIEDKALSGKFSWPITVEDESVFMELFFEKQAGKVTLTPRKFHITDDKEHAAPK